MVSGIDEIPAGVGTIMTALANLGPYPTPAIPCRRFGGIPAGPSDLRKKSSPRLMEMRRLTTGRAFDCPDAVT